MVYHLRGVITPLVALFFAALHAKALKNTLRKVSRSKDAPGGDCYTPYEGKPLLKITECTPHMATETLELMSMGVCICLGSAGELLTPSDGCCTSAPVVCDVEAVARLKNKFNESVLVVHNNTANYYRNVGGEPKSFVPLPSEVDVAGEEISEFYNSWRKLEDQQIRIERIVSRCNFAQQIEIGKSIENRSINAVRFTGKNYKPGKSLKMLLTFQMHAREWISGMSGVYFIEKMAEKLKKHPDWLSDDEIVIMPMVNPDGFKFSQESDRLWRKNMRDNGDSKTLRNCDGVDINRNFPTGWGGHKTASPNFCSEIYWGQAAASEPETQAVMKMVDEGDVCLHIDYHSFSELILAPWSYKDEPHPDRAKIDKLMKAMDNGIKSNSGKHFQTGGNEILYSAAGIAPDYTTEQGGWGLTIELSPNDVWGTGGFLLPEKEIATTVKDAFAAFVEARTWMHENGCSGKTKAKKQ